MERKEEQETRNFVYLGVDYDKNLVELAVMNTPSLPGTILRLPAVYGPRDYQHRMFSFLKRYAFWRVLSGGAVQL